MNQPPPVEGFREGLFDGKVVVVTGGGRGIGQAALLKAARYGAAAVAIDLDAENLADTRARLERLGADSLCVLGDVSAPGLLESLITQIEQRWGRLDGWVNNAYATCHAPAEQMPLDPFTHAWEVNVKVPMLAAKLTVPLFRKAGGGSIVNVSSVLAHRTRAGQMAYTSSKSALEGLTRGLAVDLGHEGIRVNAVLPGQIETGKFEPNVRKRLGDQATPERLDTAVKMFQLGTRQYPLGRCGFPDDLANPILFLLSDLSRYITGVCLPVDGGMLINGTEPLGVRMLELAQQYLALREQAGLSPR